MKQLSSELSPPMYFTAKLYLPDFFTQQQPPSPKPRIGLVNSPMNSAYSDLSTNESCLSGLYKASSRKDVMFISHGVLRKRVRLP